MLYSEPHKTTHTANLDDGYNYLLRRKHAYSRLYTCVYVCLPLCAKTEQTSSSAIAERPRCRVGQFWPKVEDDILQTI